MAAKVIGGETSSFSGPQQWKYDAFLSFRGKSTRLTFTSHLYQALRKSGVNAFRDDNNLQRGEDIPLSLQKAIWSSRVAVIVLSEDYADSRWCLEELASIMDCRTETGQLVLPIFYNVDPSDVRRQMGKFESAFLGHEKRFALEKDKVARWKAAMTEVGNLSGWDLTNFAYSDEAKTIQAVVHRILNELQHSHMDVAKYPIGIESRVQELSSLMEVGFDDVRFVGIWGMGGIGKTTLAKALYNRFFHYFEGKSFLANVRELSAQINGLGCLQQQLLSDILRFEVVKVSYFSRGTQFISNRLKGIKVLIVLDDISDPKQLQILARERNWFGPGSRIIITTRDLHLLKEIEPVYIYNAQVLNDEEALQLFSGHAFRSSNPKGEFVKLSKEIINYSKGVPLSLEVLGSFLLDRSVEEWRSALLKLQEIPHSRIQSQLRLSYDALSDDKEKDLFLDIACFFVGFDRDYAVKILNGCGLFAELGLSILTERCLVEVDKANKLKMHDLIRDMGREIVREESFIDPGKRSRLWQPKDIETTLLNHIGTEEVRGIAMSPTWMNTGLKLNAEAFEKMTRLRLLQLHGVCVKGKFELLSKDLRWLCWHGFRLKSIPDEFCMKNLIALDMQNSSLVQAWKNDKFLGKLKVLNLSYSRFLTKTPDFLKLPNLEELMLRDCVELVDVHHSIGHLKKLVSLNLKNCKQIKSIPDSICRVKSLKTLNISGCSKIDRLPEEIGDMESLAEFLAEGTAITQVPISISQLRSLTNLSLSLQNHKRPNPSFISTLFRLSDRRNVTAAPAASLFQLSSLRTLRLTNCNLSNDAISIDNIGSLPFLENLDLSRNGFSRLPNGIGNLPRLKTLILDDCTSLEVLPGLPPSLSVLSVINSISIIMGYIGDKLSYSQYRICPCEFLGRFPAARSVIRMDRWEDRANRSHPSASSNLEQFLRKDEEDAYWSSRWLNGNCKIPEWFDYKSATPSLSFKMPLLVHRCNQKGVTICVVYEASKTFTLCTCRELPVYRVVVINKGNKLELTHQTENDIGEVMHKGRTYMWMIQLPQKVVFRDELCFEGEVELEADCSDKNLNVLTIGVHFGDQICRYCYSSSSVREDEELPGSSSSRSNEAVMRLSCEFDLLKLMSSKLSKIRRDRTHELQDQIVVLENKVVEVARDIGIQIGILEDSSSSAVFNLSTKDRIPKRYRAEGGESSNSSSKPKSEVEVKQEREEEVEDEESSKRKKTQSNLRIHQNLLKSFSCFGQRLKWKGSTDPPDHR